MLTVIVRGADGSARTLAFAQPQVTVGRDATNDVCFPVGSVSKFHARLSWHDGACRVEDLGSTNGTLVDGKTVKDAIVGPNSTVTIGDFHLRIQANTSQNVLKSANRISTRESVAVQSSAPETIATAPLPDMPMPLDALPELGPLGELLEDPTVTRVQCVRHDVIHVTRNGHTTLSGLGFASEEALRTAIDRLVQPPGRGSSSKMGWDASDLILERRLRSGTRVLAMAPPLSEHVCCTIIPRIARSSTMADLVSAMVLTSEQAEQLAHALQARRNLFVCGVQDARAGAVLAALVSTLAESERIAVVHAGVDVAAHGRPIVSLALPVNRGDELETLRAAHALGFERVVVTAGRPELAAKAIEVAAEGAAASIVVVAANTLENATVAIAAQLALAHPGAPESALTTIMRSGIDLGVQLAVGAKGALRVERLGELAVVDGELVIRDRAGTTTAATAPKKIAPDLGTIPPTQAVPSRKKTVQSLPAVQNRVNIESKMIGVPAPPSTETEVPTVPPPTMEPPPTVT